jgi:limonene-1,2-epoxide hydrolase
MVRGVSGAQNVAVVRMLWTAVREQDIDAVISLADPEVDWEPTAVSAGKLHGDGELRSYLSRLRAAGTLADAHPYSFEAVGACVIVSGALRLRRGGDLVDTVQRWWVYEVVGGRVIAATSHGSRPDALRAARGRGVTPR